MSDGRLGPGRRREVLRESLSVGVAIGAYGVSFGALAVAAGLDVWQAQALSLLMFTGGSQFAFVGIVANGLPAAPSAVAAASMLGIRNGPLRPRADPAAAAARYPTSRRRLHGAALAEAPPP